MQLYGLKTCDTTRKALKSLREGGQQVTYIDVRKDGIPEASLKIFLGVFGEDLINRRSTTWRGLSDSERAGDALELLVAHPTLMKRPVIWSGNTFTLGWGKDVQEKYLG